MNWRAMPVRHHPSAQVRADYVSGQLSPGSSLAFTAHLQLCSICTIAVEALGGPATELHDGLRAGAASGVSVLQLPRGRSRAVGRKQRAAWLKGVSGVGECVWLLEAQAGARLALASEDGIWGGVVLSGDMRDGEVVLQAGDFFEAGAHPAPQPTVQRDAVVLLVTDEAWGRWLWRRLVERTDRR